MRGFDSYRLLTLSLAALMTRISSAMIEGAHTSAGAATLARTGSLWGRFRTRRTIEHSRPSPRGAPRRKRRNFAPHACVICVIASWMSGDKTQHASVPGGDQVTR